MENIISKKDSVMPFKIRENDYDFVDPCPQEMKQVPPGQLPCCPLHAVVPRCQSASCPRSPSTGRCWPRPGQRRRWTRSCTHSECEVDIYMNISNSVMSLGWCAWPGCPSGRGSRRRRIWRPPGAETRTSPSGTPARARAASSRHTSGSGHPQ